MNAPVKKFKPIESDRNGRTSHTGAELNCILLGAGRGIVWTALHRDGCTFIVCQKKIVRAHAGATRRWSTSRSRSASCTGVIVDMVLEESGLARRVASDIDGSGRYFKRIAK